MYLLMVIQNVVTLFEYDKGNNKLPNSEQSYKGKVKTHKYINRQNQSTTGKLWKLWRGFRQHNRDYSSTLQEHYPIKYLHVWNAEEMRQTLYISAKLIRLKLRPDNSDIKMWVKSHLID